MPVWMYLAFSRYFDDQHEEDKAELQPGRAEVVS
jgi:hypothetical protein